MKIKLLQLNIFQGRYLDNIIDFVKKNDFDILHFQEVTGGGYSEGGIYYVPEKFLKEVKGIRSKLSSNEKYIGIDCFGEIKKRLSYEGFISKNAIMDNDESSYFGNATFYKKNLKPEESRIFTIKKAAQMRSLDEFNPKTVGRSVVLLKYNFPNENIWFVNTHLLWGPTSFDDKPRLKEGKMLIDYLGKLGESFVLSGDFNLSKESEVIEGLSKISVNQAKNLPNTLNPEVHAARSLFPPGLAVDYIFTSPQIKTANFKLVEKPNLSDHLGLSIEIEV